MPLYNDTYQTVSPFGINEFLRSTQDVKTESYTLAASTVTAQTIDGNPNQKILQPGTVLAKITSGPELGKVGPYSTDTVGVTDGRSSTANIVGVDRTAAPWQLTVGDLEVAVVYDAALVQGWCLEYSVANPAGGALSNATANAMRPGGAAAVNGVAILWKS